MTYTKGMKCSKVWEKILTNALYPHLCLLWGATEPGLRPDGDASFGVEWVIRINLKAKKKKTSHRWYAWSAMYGFGCSYLIAVFWYFTNPFEEPFGKLDVAYHYFIKVSLSLYYHCLTSCGTFKTACFFSLYLNTITPLY